MRLFLFGLSWLLVGALITSCTTNSTCQHADDCLNEQRCDTSSKTCVPGCKNDDDCIDSQQCNLSNRQCEKRIVSPCPNAQERDKKTGLCVCTTAKDCNDTEQCNSQGLCQKICLPGSAGPDVDSCSCPSNWEWIRNQCRMKCPKDLPRGEDGNCQLNHTKLYPKLWEKNAKDEIIPTCSTGVQRDSNGFCARKLLQEKPGPQKPCPSNATDKWDEAYIKRNKLDPSVPVLFVEKAAALTGDGSKSKPFQTLQEAATAAKKHSNAVILVAPGTYTWGLKLSSSLHLVGRCTEQVTLRATSASKGPAIQSSGPSMTIEGFKIEGNGSNSGEGIQSLSNQGTLTVRHVSMKRTSLAGIYVAGGSVIIEHCDISETAYQNLSVNGTLEKVADGVRLDLITGELTLRLNRLHKNPTWGAHLHRALEARIEGNWFAENGTTVPYNKGGLHIYDRERRGSKHPRNGTVVVRSNEFYRNIGYAMFAAYYKELQFNDNLVHKNGFIDIAYKVVRLLYIDKLSLVRNHFLENSAIATRMYLVAECAILDNIYKGNALSSRYTYNDEPFVAMSITYKNQGNYIIRGNVFEGNHDGIGINVGTLLIEGNLFKNNMYRGLTPSGTNPTIQANRFINNGLYGIEMWGKTLKGDQRHLVQHNLFQGNGKRNIQRERAAFRLGNGNVQLELNHNLFQDNFIGAVFGGLKPDANLRFTGNVWRANKHVGVMFASSQGSLHIEKDLFESNFGTHLLVTNNRQAPVIKQCGFSDAKPGEEFSLQSIPKTEGVGVHIGAQGLVRWVFAKADYTCSPTQKGQVPKLQDGWTMRPVRLPLAFDPCQSWNYSYDYHSEQARMQAGACQACREKGMGCRLIWEDVGIGKSKGTGLWRPANPVMQCVPSGQYDTCTNPYPETTVPLQTSNFASRVGGQCLPLSEKNDPCKRKEFNLCHQQSRLRKKFCVRVKNNFSKDYPVQGECRDWGANEFAILCRPDHKAPYNCKQGTQCFGETVALKPLDMAPGAATLENNVFWNNLGPDVQMDHAGHVKLTNNTFLFCDPSQPPCTVKHGYRRSIRKAGEDKISNDWEQVKLPPGATLVWQNPSPYDAPIDSKLLGEDLQRTLHSLPLLFRPDLCQTLSTH